MKNLTKTEEKCPQRDPRSLRADQADHPAGGGLRPHQGEEGVEEGGQEALQGQLLQEEGQAQDGRGEGGLGAFQERLRLKYVLVKRRQDSRSSQQESSGLVAPFMYH
jgi:hypothetical protein